MNTNDYNQIEAYLFNLLTESERADFEEKLDTDENLQAAVNLHRLEHKAIQVLEEEKLRAQFVEWKQEKQAYIQTTSNAKVVDMNTRRQSLVYRLSAAASILLFVSVGSLWFANNNYSNSALADAAFELSSNTKGIENTTPSDFEFAERAFMEGRYSEVVGIYENIISTNNNPTEVHLAEWNLANTQLASNNSQVAKRLLEQIATDDAHTYQDEAKKLLVKLNSFWRNFVNG